VDAICQVDIVSSYKKQYHKLIRIVNHQADFEMLIYSLITWKPSSCADEISVEVKKRIPNLAVRLNRGLDCISEDSIATFREVGCYKRR